MMIGLDYIRSIRNYCSYLEEHLDNVFTAWKEVQEACRDMKFIYDDYEFSKIDELIRKHDVSKFCKHEFTQYAFNFFPPTNEFMTDYKKDFAAASERHVTRNPHHWQMINEMSDVEQYYRHVVCMVVDWTAIGYKYNDTAQVYYEKNKDKIKLPEWAVKFMYQIFERLNKYNKQ